MEPRTKQEHQTLLRRAQKALRKVRRDAQQHRENHLEILLKRYGLLDDKKMQQIIRRLIQAEATKRCYKKLRWITKPPKPGVTFVERHTHNGTTETLYDRTTVEEAILQRNKRHFNQCAGTPFTIGELRKLNWAADSASADDILQGTAPVDRISSNGLVQQVLQECNKSEQLYLIISPQPIYNNCSKNGERVQQHRNRVDIWGSTKQYSYNAHHPTTNKPSTMT